MNVPEKPPPEEEVVLDIDEKQEKILRKKYSELVIMDMPKRNQRFPPEELLNNL